MQNNERNVLKMANFHCFVWQNSRLTHINQISERNFVIFVDQYHFLKDLGVANENDIFGWWNTMNLPEIALIVSM